jgi:hypothetical protein
MENTKKCPKCEIVLPVSSFYVSKSKHTKKGWRYNSECKECSSIYSKKYREAKLDQYKSKSYSRQIKYRYGITKEERDHMLSIQNGLCAICNKDISDKPYIDHSHDTGRVRGLLCLSCNSGIGSLQDSPEILQKAIDYLLTNS